MGAGGAQNRLEKTTIMGTNHRAKQREHAPGGKARNEGGTAADTGAKTSASAPAVRTRVVTPQLDALIAANPDLVDRIFEYIVQEVPGIAAPRLAQLKIDIRAEFAGEDHYIPKRPVTERQALVAQVLALFNGRNASELARTLQISRATVYRVLKQPGRA